MTHFLGLDDQKLQRWRDSPRRLLDLRHTVHAHGLTNRNQQIQRGTYQMKTSTQTKPSSIFLADTLKGDAK